MKTILNWQLLKTSATLVILTALPVSAQTQSAEVWTSQKFFTDGDCRVFAEQTINNSGTVLWGDGKNLTLRDGAVFNNLTGGVFRVTNNGSMVYDDTSAFNNFGLFEQMTGMGTTFMGNFTNYGTVNLQSGTLSFAYDYNQVTGATILAGGELNTWPNHLSILGGVLKGQGSIDAGNWNPGVLNNGTIMPTGVLKIMNASFAQTSAGSLNIVLGGNTAGSDYGQLVVAREAALDGTLNITLTNGYQPRLGETFEILQCKARKGQFSAIHCPKFGGGLVFQPRYTAKNLTLTVVEKRPPSNAKQALVRRNAIRAEQAMNVGLLSYQQ